MSGVRGGWSRVGGGSRGIGGRENEWVDLRRRGMRGRRVLR